MMALLQYKWTYKNNLINSMDWWEKTLVFIIAVILIWLIVSIGFWTYSWIKFREFQIECVEVWWKLINEILPWNTSNNIYCTSK